MSRQLSLLRVKDVGEGKGGRCNWLVMTSLLSQGTIELCCGRVECWYHCPHASMLYCAVLCWAEPCWAALPCAVLCSAMLCYAMLCYAMLCYAMLCYAMLCYAMLCYANNLPSYLVVCNLFSAWSSAKSPSSPSCWVTLATCSTTTANSSYFEKKN